MGVVSSRRGRHVGARRLVAQCTWAAEPTRLVLSQLPRAFERNLCRMLSLEIDLPACLMLDRSMLAVGGGVSFSVLYRARSKVRRRDGKSTANSSTPSSVNPPPSPVTRQPSSPLSSLSSSIVTLAPRSTAWRHSTCKLSCKSRGIQN